ncbi:MAG: PDZ domain-containing protein [Planctomycetota bacterium]|nr:MAG: PDZ domain-containing protein [Planctomycetota bacterium]
MTTPRVPLRVLLLSVLLLRVALPAQEPAKKEGPKPTLPPSWVEQLRWRSIGPANMGGRIVDIAVDPTDSSRLWVATASGGLLHTENGGITWEHQFDHEHTVSLGDVTVAPSNPQVVWVGTGENNPRNSVSWGDGVYKSVDGGKTWKHMGLSESFQTGRILIHPEDENIVYVGALGRLWGPNEERGLYKTTDGGETWTKVLDLGPDTGVIDMRMKPDDPETLLVASYERRRDGFDTNDPARKWGDGGGLWRTTDGGRTWQRITEGIPDCKLGRIGLDWFAGDPNVVFAVIESELITQEPEDAAYMGVQGEDAEVGARLTEVTEDGPAAVAGLKKGDIVLRVEDTTVHSWAELTREIHKRLAGETVEVEVSRDRKAVTAEVTFSRRPSEKEDAEEKEPEAEKKEAAGEEKPPAPGPFHIGLGGQRENAQDEQGPEGWRYGGVYRSDDAGLTWRRINSLNPRPMYYSQIRVDPSDARYLYVLGTSLYKSSDGGATFTADGHGPEVHVDHHALWIDPADGRHMWLGNDGGLYETRDRMAHWDHHNQMAIGQFYRVEVGPRLDYRVYGGLQDNGSWGGPSRSASGRGPTNADWFRVGGGDGFFVRVDREDPDQIYSESQNGAMGSMNLRTGARGSARPRPPRGERYRFNWNTPFLLSHHNSRIHYSAGNKVFRSLDRGRNPQPISPEIAVTDRGSATALDESPRDPNVLYVGTDDGGLWATTDGGHTWTDLWELPAPAPDAAVGEEDGRAGEAAAEPALPERLREFDADGDGRLQAEELPERMAGFLARLDQDGDGVLTGAEFEAARAARGGRGGGRRPGRGRRAGAAASESSPASAPTQDPVAGVWNGKVEAEGMAGEEGSFTLVLKRKDDRITGTLSSEMGESEVKSGRFADGALELTIQSEMGELKVNAAIQGDRMTGTLVVGGGMFEMDFTAEHERKQPAAAAAGPDAAKPIAELMPGRRWVSSLVASRFADGRVYLTFDGHRSDDDAPYVFVSEDHGRSWRSLRADLPDDAGSVRSLKEDLENENLLFLGTEFGAWVSIDRGASWTRLNSNLPTVAVHDFAIHPLRRELVAATHGRSLWILDITPLRQFSAETVADPVHLYRPNDVVLWRRMPERGISIREFVGENPPASASIFYSLGRRIRGLKLWVEDLSGEKLRDLEAPAEPGLHRVEWDLRRAPEEGSRRRWAPRVRPGTYVAVLRAGDATYRQRFEVRNDPSMPDETWLRAEEEAERNGWDEPEKEETAQAPERRIE